MRCRFIAFVLLAALVVTMAPAPSTAAEPKLHVQFYNRHSVCDAGLTTKGRLGSYVVAARQYAKCISAEYKWFPHARTFHLRKWSPIGMNGWGYVKILFDLDNGQAHEYHGDRYVRTYDVEASTGVAPYERDSDTANMAPLRFINDVFRLGTRWTPGTGPYTVINGEALDEAPRSDRVRISEIGLIRDGRLAFPLSGSPLLPSTTRRLVEFVPYAREMEKRAKEAQKPHEVSWTNLAFRYMNYWGDKPVAQFSVNGGHHESTAWFHTSGTARQMKKDLENTKGLWEAATGYTTAAAALGTGLAIMYGAEIGGPLGVAAALAGASWVGANRHYSVRIRDIENCIADAEDYADKHDVEFSMGLRWTLWGFECVDHYEP